MIVLTRLAVLLATSLADCTKCRLATGLAVLEEASRQALHSAEVCLATMVAAESTCNMYILNILALKVQIKMLQKEKFWAQVQTLHAQDLTEQSYL